MNITKAGLLLTALSGAFILGAIFEKKVRLLSIAQAAVTKPADVSFKTSPYYLSKTSIFDDLPVSAGDAVFIGDGITALAELQELYNSPRVKNRGINGDTTGGALKRLSQIYDGKPAAVFLLAGINNLQGGISVAQTTRELREIVGTIHAKSPATVVFVQPLLPVNRDKYSLKILSRNSGVVEPAAQDIAAINTELRAIAAGPGAHFVPLDALLDDKGQLKGEFTEDGLHLNGAGLRAWANVIRSVAAGYL